MAQYMVQFTFTPEAWAALLRKPEDRTGAVKALADKMGGRIISYHYCFGEYDGVIMADLPDDKAAMATVLASFAGGHLRSIKTTPLFTIADAMEAMKKGGSVTFQGPKG